MHNSQPTPIASQREFDVPDNATMMSITDIKGNILYANKAFLEVSGYAAEELIGQPHKLMRHPDVPPEVFADMWATLQAGESWSGLVMNLRKNGDHYWVRVNATPVIRRGRLVGYLSVRTRPGADEVEHARKIYKLLKEKRATDVAFDKGVIVHKGLAGWKTMLRRMSVRARILCACAAAAAIALAGVGATTASAVAMASVLLGGAVCAWLLDWQIVRPLQRLQKHAQTVASGQPAYMTSLDRTDEIGMLRRAVNQSGLNLLTLLGEVSDPFSAAEGASSQAAVADNDELVRTEIGRLVHAIGRMERNLSTDKLTGTRNRAFLTEQFNAWKRNAQAGGDSGMHALLFVDLDNFKHINDRYGHDIGDEVLVTSANRLSQAVRSVDVISRHDDDKFLVLLRDSGQAASVGMVAEKIRYMLEQTIEVREGVVRVGASVGWAVFPEDGDDIDALLQVSNQQMMENKRSRQAARATDGDVDAQGNAPQLYGHVWAPAMASFTTALQPHITQIVDRLYEHLAFVPGVDHLIKSLGEEDFGKLRSLTTKNLLMLASPALTEEEHRKVALKVGRVHAIAGVERDGLVRSHDILHDVTRSHVDTFRHGEAFSVLARRLIRDLAWQAQAYQNMQSARHDLMLEITQIAWRADSYTNLISQVAERLGLHDEFAGCIFGRPDHEKVFQSEVVVGDRVKTYLADVESKGGFLLAGPDPLKWGPTGRCWHTRQIEHCLNIETDLRMEPWRAVARSNGLNSMAAVPLCHPNGEPMAVLSVYSHFPGGFVSAEQRALLAQLQSLLVFAIIRIENREGTTHTVPFSVRQHLSGLLRAGGLDMHYQPLVELKTGKVVQVEALARLKDGTRTLFPGEFMSSLSSDDLLVLYRLGLQQALSQRALWQQDGFDLRVSINLPSDAFFDLRYYDATQAALHESDFPPHLLTLEVLESEEMPKDNNATDILGQFKALGVHLSEDDLGSGHSSLTRLRELPFDSIKIDRSIVTLADQDPSNVLRFIYQLTRLGHSLGKQVVVEGVENADMLEAIRILGPDIVQGYVIARPMPAQNLRDWIKNRREFAGLQSPLSPQSTLAKLASLLIWEERLHMHLHLGSNGAAPEAESSVQMEQGPQESSPQESAVDGVPPVQPGDSVIHQALLATAIQHGLHSPEYRTMRQQLVAVADGLGMSAQACEDNVASQ